MKYLKKNTVKLAILLARACQGHEDMTLPDINADGAEDDVADGSNGDPNVKAFNDFLDGLSEGEFAELTALLWLGQDVNLLPRDWDIVVAKAETERLQDLRQVSKFKFPEYVRHGMERLARFHRGQKTVKTGRNVDTELPAEVVTPADLDRRIHLAGRFVIDAFNQKYGSTSGIRKLAEIMELKGYLTSPADRRIFGLSPVPERESLESVLRTAEFPPPVPGTAKVKG